VPELIILGSAASVPDAAHDTVGQVLCGLDWAVLVDCGGSPVYKLAQVGIELESIQAVILTHKHADHIYGLPLLVQGLWLGGRTAPLPIFGPREAINTSQRLLALFGLSERADIFSLDWHPVPLREARHVLAIEGVEIRATPVDHREVQALAYRFENTGTGRRIVYSGDTEPCPELVKLASGANLLLHEASGALPGHSSPAQAAEIASAAGVETLALTHYPVREVDLEAWRRSAVGFPGRVVLAHDGDRYPL
jgi:ribonuclease Z